MSLLLIGTIALVVLGVVGLFLSFFAKKDRSRMVGLASTAAALLVLLVGLVGLLVFNVNASRPPKYDFEAGAEGWACQAQGGGACLSVRPSGERYRHGTHSLQVEADLAGGDRDRDRGEVWVNLMKNPPGREIIPTDLEGHKVTVWVFCPEGSGGDPHRPNGLQVFVKDEAFRNEYGNWHGIVEGKWLEVSLTVGDSKPSHGVMDPGFNPTKIVAVGIKLASGGGSTATYQGPIWIDEVRW